MVHHFQFKLEKQVSLREYSIFIIYYPMLRYEFVVVAIEVMNAMHVFNFEAGRLRPAGYMYSQIW